MSIAVATAFDYGLMLRCEVSRQIGNGHFAHGSQTKTLATVLAQSPRSAREILRDDSPNQRAVRVGLTRALSTHEQRLRPITRPITSLPGRAEDKTQEG